MKTDYKLSEDFQCPPRRGMLTREECRALRVRIIVWVGLGFLVGYGCGIWACHIQDVAAFLSRVIYHVKPL